MMSTHSSTDTQIKRTIYLIFRNNWAVAVLVLILMLVAVPLILIMLPVRAFDAARIGELFQLFVGIPLFLITVLTLIISAGQMFTFLHKQTSIDVFLALPVRRKTLFTGLFAGGALLVLLPQVLTFSAVLLLRLLPGYSILDLALVIRTALAFLLISLALYAAAVFSFVVTGRLFDAMFLLLMLNIAFPATLYTIDWMTDMILPGFSQVNFVSLINIDRYLLLSPIGQLLKVAFQPMSGFEIFWWILLVLILSAGSLLIFIRRPSEKAGQMQAYRLPFQIIRFLICLIAGLFFGYMYYFLYSTLAAFAFSAVVGSFAVHTLIEAILSRGFHNFRKSLPSYGVFLLLFTAGCLIVTTGFAGYDTRLPDKDSVAEVRMAVSTNDVYLFENNSDIDLVLTNQDNIDKMLEMNRVWLNHLQTKTVKPYSLQTNHLISVAATKTGYTPYRLIYNLKNGTRIVRTVYFNFSEEPYATLHRQIRETEEYKRQQYKHLFRPESEIMSMFVYNKTGFTVQSLSGSDSNALAGDIQTALQQDLLQFADEQTDSTTICYLNILLRYGRSGPIGNQGYTTVGQYFQLTDAFKNTVDLLKQHNLLDDLDADRNNFTKAYITTLSASDGSFWSRLTRYQRGPYSYPSSPGVNSDWPRLNDEQVFICIDNPNLVQTLYDIGQHIPESIQDGYLVVLAAEGWVEANGTTSTPLPVLFIPVQNLPSELTNLLE